MAATSTASRAWLATATIGLLVAAQCLLPLAEGAVKGPCGSTPLLVAAASLLPCKAAASSPTAKVSPDCCKKVSLLSPTCLCAVLTSSIAKQANIKPANAISIPKRCGAGIKARRAGQKCGSFIIP